MTITPDWPTIIGGALVALGIGGTTIPWIRSILANQAAAISENGRTVERSADEPPPAGSVEWVADIVRAMPTAPEKLMLQALQEGATRDAARQMHQEYLLTEAKAPAKGAKS